MIEEYLTKKLVDELWSRLKEIIQRKGPTPDNEDDTFEKILAEAFAELVRPDHDLHRLNHLLQAAGETGKYSYELGVLREQLKALNDAQHLKTMEHSLARLADAFGGIKRVPEERIIDISIKPTIQRIIEFTASYGYKVPNDVADFDVESEVVAVYLFPEDWSRSSPGDERRRAADQSGADRLGRLLDFLEKVMARDILEAAVGTSEESLYVRKRSPEWRRKHLLILPKDDRILLYW